MLPLTIFPLWDSYYNYNFISTKIQYFQSYTSRVRLRRVYIAYTRDDAISRYPCNVATGLRSTRYLEKMPARIRQNSRIPRNRFRKVNSRLDAGHTLRLLIVFVRRGDELYFRERRVNILGPKLQRFLSAIIITTVVSSKVK